MGRYFLYGCSRSHDFYIFNLQSSQHQRMSWSSVSRCAILVMQRWQNQQVRNTVLFQGFQRCYCVNLKAALVRAKCYTGVFLFCSGMQIYENDLGRERYFLTQPQRSLKALLKQTKPRVSNSLPGSSTKICFLSFKTPGSNLGGNLRGHYKNCCAQNEV